MAGIYFVFNQCTWHKGKLWSPTALSNTSRSCASSLLIFSAHQWFFFPGNCPPWAIIRNDFHVPFTARCLFCLLKKSSLWLSLSLLPASQLRLSPLSFLFESLIPFPSHAHNLLFVLLLLLLFCFLVPSFSLLVANQDLAKKERIRVQKWKSTVYNSTNIVPALKIHYVFEIIRTRILMHMDVWSGEESLILWHDHSPKKKGSQVSIKHSSLRPALGNVRSCFEKQLKPKHIAPWLLGTQHRVKTQVWNCRFGFTSDPVCAFGARTFTRHWERVRNNERYPTDMGNLKEQRSFKFSSWNFSPRGFIFT